MGNWKEVGVVPDSDDEGWGSEDSQPFSPFETLPQPPYSRADTRSHAVRDSDEPSESSNDPRFEVDLSAAEPRKLASNSTDPIITDHTASQLLGVDVPELEENGAVYDIRRESPDPLADDCQEYPISNASLSFRDDISSSIIHLTAASANPFLGSSADETCHETVLPRETEDSEKDETTPPTTSGERHMALAPRPVHPARSTRSLRPRKPIQEHPYLLENAQYSKLVKSHGVKPVRISVEEREALRHRDEAELPDQDYKADESQTGTAENEGSQMSRPNNRKPLEDETDELALSQTPTTSSPQRNLRASSEQSPGKQTDATSVVEDEEFPDIRDLTATRRRPSGAPSKRVLTSATSTSRKRPRTKQPIPLHDFDQESPSRIQTTVWDLPISPVASHLISTTRAESSPNSSSQALSLPRDSRFLTSSPPASPIDPRIVATEPIDLTSDNQDMELEDSNAEESDGSRLESDAEEIRKTGRRIRGVLPASWLRLDQQHRKEASSGTARRSSPRSREQSRPGLALRKTVGSKHSLSTKSFLDELQQDEDREFDKTVQQVDLDVGHEILSTNHGSVNIDDANSVVEEDFIDWMLPGQKRQRNAAGGPAIKRRRTKQNLFKGEARRLYRQPKITASMRHFGRTSEAGRRNADRQVRIPSHRASSPPALSIVDFAGTDAPSFIKVAVRAARQRQNMGRSKPSNKSINLGNRADNSDALGVLKDWKAGKIKASTAPRILGKQGQTVARAPLRPFSANIGRQSGQPVKLSFARPQKLTRQVGVDRSTSQSKAAPTALSEERHVKTAGIKSTRLNVRKDDSAIRPGQLEADIPESLATRKKMLDLVFRRNRGELLAPTFQMREATPSRDRVFPCNSDNSTEDCESHIEPRRFECSKAPSSSARPSRSRKAGRPRRVDLEAPQFKHANEPFASYEMPTVENETSISRQEQSKISGLGPFGAHYTQHFDVFPLQEDTFFHQSTLIGKGVLHKAISLGIADVVGHARPATTFQHVLHSFTWGRWTDTLSSEMGLVFDLLGENLEDGKRPNGSKFLQNALDCMDHVLHFIVDSVSVAEESDIKPFVLRSTDLLLRFVDQTQPLAANHHIRRTLVQVNSRLLIYALVLIKLCRGKADLSSEFFQAEEAFQRVAKSCIEQLLDLGLSEIQKTYDDLQRLAFRERGIRSNAVTMTCWVIVIRTLESAQIPRAGFWDLVSPAMTNRSHWNNDAQNLESLWRDMFILLPLGEFDDGGVLVKGLRHTVPLQGWALPQKLLKCVFEAYQRNQRQSPSFNDYCRALLGRCHYLLDQWGWFKCVGIVGTVFDFFGRQNLSHLRNEEVFKSPRFLEELCDGPELSIEPEDRCFHIFLKILAVAIQKMRQHGLSNDVRNLIARCLPNHDRHYSKEQAIHSQDLASLRNHHDLLCTLFWAAPPEERRPVDLLENLVEPAGSHKEACLINLRAWSQLARFVISSGGSMQEFRPFMSWQNNVFQQILNQYLSAATDVQQQFMSLAKEDRGGVQQHFLDKVIASNQAAAKDVLYCSVVASLDVMKQCRTLSSSMLSFNVMQMSKVFSKLTVTEKNPDWGLLRVSFETIDVFVQRLEAHWCASRESSAETISSNEDHEFEDAVEFLEDKVVQGLFTAVRRAMAQTAGDMTPKAVAESVALEKAVILCGRIASLVINGGKRQLQHFFAGGKYGLFEAHPRDLGLAGRTFLPLFVATLLKNHIFDFSGIGCSHFDLWVLSLVKPYHALKYENRLAETLQTLDMGFMQGAAAKLGARPDYITNREYFAAGVSYMRRHIKQAETGQRRLIRAKYEKMLRSVMQQMKTDLKSFESRSAEHQDYVNFVRGIVGLVKSHGSDICTIDPFFYEASADYSPAQEDPQLHTAGILAYGLKMGEGETTAIPQLFHYLYNHFKTSLASGQLDSENKIVQNGMADDNVLAFVIGRMLPAIIRVSSENPGIWPLLGVYSRSLGHVLGQSVLPREIPQTCVEGVSALLAAVLDWMRALAQSGEVATGLQPVQVHVLTELMSVCNAVRPSILAWLMQPSLHSTLSLQKHAEEITRVVGHAAQVLNGLAVGRGQTAVGDVQIKALLQLAQREPWRRVQPDSHVDSFVRVLSHDLKHSWRLEADFITIAIASGTSTQLRSQPRHGVRNDIDTRVGLLPNLLASLSAWLEDVSWKEADLDRSHQLRRRRQRRWMRSEILSL